MLLSHTAVSSHLIRHCLERAPASAAVADASLCVFSVLMFCFFILSVKSETASFQHDVEASPDRRSSFPGAYRVFCRTQPCSPCCRPSPSHLTFHSRSRQPSGPKPSRQIPCLGEARISRVFYQGQAKELQDPGCRSKRISFQSDWRGPLGTPEQERHSGTGSWPGGSGWRKPSS